MVGDHVEFVLDFGGDGSLSGNRYEGEAGGDESVLDEILTGFILQEVFQ